MVQLGVDAVECQQLLLSAVFDHHAVLDDDDLVRIAQRAEAMGDCEDRAALHQSFHQCVSPCGRYSSVSVTILSSVASGIEGLRPRPSRTCPNLTRPSSANRVRQFAT